MRFLIMKLPERKIEFNIARGHIVKKRLRYNANGFASKLQISIKHPFVKYLNLGRSMQDKNRLNKLLVCMKDLIKAASLGKAEELFMEMYTNMISEEEQELRESSAGTG